MLCHNGIRTKEQEKDTAENINFIPRKIKTTLP
jgi:hypothetical protein